MPADDADDRAMLEAIRAYCAARNQAADSPTAPPDAESLARRRAYGKVARAARELLEEMDG